VLGDDVDALAVGAHGDRCGVDGLAVDAGTPGPRLAHAALGLRYGPVERGGCRHTEAEPKGKGAEKGTSQEPPGETLPMALSIHSRR
jgi:hypothetical protein